jgi:hypothetical protein
MSKEPSVSHDYHAKKDRFEITIKHYALKKKSDREALIKHLLHLLEKSAGLVEAYAESKRKDRPKSPFKESRIPQVGD